MSFVPPSPHVLVYIVDPLAYLFGYPETYSIFHPMSHAVLSSNAYIVRLFLCGYLSLCSVSCNVRPYRLLPLGSSHDQLIRFRTAVEKPLKAHEARRGKPRTSCCLLVLDVRLDSTQIYNLSGFILCPLYCTRGWLVQS